MRDDIRFLRLLAKRAEPDREPPCDVRAEVLQRIRSQPPIAVGDRAVTFTLWGGIVAAVVVAAITFASAPRIRQAKTSIEHPLDALISGSAELLVRENPLTRLAQ